MDSARFQIIDEIFRATREVPAGERDQRIVELARGDEHVIAQVKLLLDADARDHPLLDHANPIARVARTVAEDHEASASAPGSRTHVPSVPGYELLEVIGEGGMGVVYRARQENPPRTVAIKFIHPIHADTETMQRFVREAAMLAQLDHPGIARIHEAGSVRHHGVDRPFMVMEWIDGLDLATWVVQMNATPEQIVDRLTAIADAVAHAHERGIVHRDLKPGNVLVQGDGRIRVLDFGAGRFMTPDADRSIHTRTGQFIGTLPYMAPEQLGSMSSERSDEAESRAGTGIGPWSDVYALGVIGFRLLTGRMPLDVAGRSLLDAAEIIRRDEPISLSRVDRRLRGNLETIIACAMRKEPARRYADAAAMAADLRRFASGLTILAREPSTIESIRRFTGRNAGLVASVAAILTLLAAGLIVTTTLLVRVDHERRIRVKEAQRADDRAVRASLSAALGALETNLYGRAKQHLAMIPLERREFVWRHLYSRIGGGPKLIAWSGMPFRDAFYDQSGRWGVTADRTGTVGFFDINGTDEISWFANTDGQELMVAAIDRDQRWLVAGGWGATHVWPMAIGKTGPRSTGDVMVLDTHSGVKDIVMLDDVGRCVLFCADGRVAIHAIGTWEHLATLQCGNRYIHGVNQIGTGEKVRLTFLTSDGRITIDPLAPSITRKLPVPESARVLRVDSERNITAIGTESGEVVIVDDTPGQTGNVIGRRQVHSSALIGLNWDRDGHLLSVSRDRRLMRTIVDDQHLPRASEAITSIVGHVFRMRGPDAEGVIALASSDGAIQFVDVDAPSEPIRCDHPQWVRRVAIDTKQRVVATSVTVSGDIRVWNADTGELKLSIPGVGADGQDLAFSPDGRWIYSASGLTLRAHSSADGTTLWEQSANAPVGIAVNESGTRLVVAGGDGEIFVHDSKTGDLLDQFGPTGEDMPSFRYRHDLTWVDENRLLVSTNNTGPIIIDLRARTVTIHERLPGRVTTELTTPQSENRKAFNKNSVERWEEPLNDFVTVSPDRLRCATAIANRTIVVQNLETGVVEQKLYSASDHISGLVYLNEGTLVAAGSSNVVEFFSTDEDEPLLSVRGHADFAECLAAASDDSFIATGGADGRLLIWHAPRGHPRAKADAKKVADRKPE